MIDIAEFQLIRDCAPPRSDDRELLHIPPPKPEEGSMPPVSTHLPATGTDIDKSQAMEALLSVLEPSRRTRRGGQPDPAVEAMAEVLRQLLALSTWLADQGDRAGAEAIRKYLEKLNSGSGFENALKFMQPLMADLLLQMLSGKEPSLDLLEQLTRLYLVAQLVLDILGAQQAPDEDAVWLLLNTRSPLVSTEKNLFKSKRVDLVRAATVSDLYVIRSEWRGYAKGDIAALRNIMARETFKQTASQITEHETTATTETSQTSVTEEYDENRTSGEMSREISAQLNASLQANVRAEYGVKTPVSSFVVSGGADARLAIGLSERYATRTSQEAIKRASSRVESVVRKARTDRELTRIEHGTEYGFTNPGDQHIRGVYRWLDRIDRYQLFRIPDRLQLEFQLPKPSEYFRWRMKYQGAITRDSAPPPFNITPDDIFATGETRTPGKPTVEVLAARYKAANLPPCPRKEISLIDSLTAEAKDVPDNGSIRQRTPLASVTKEIIIPEGYEAKSVDHSASAAPARGKWWREKPNPSEVDFNDTHEGVFHSIVLEHFIGDDRGYMTDRPGSVLLRNLNATQGTAWNHTSQFGDAFAQWNDLSTTLDPPARVRMNVGFRAVGASHLQVSLKVVCERTSESLQSWKFQVYEALYAAWQRLQQDWEAEQESALLMGRAPGAEQSASRNKQVVHEEIKRQVIAWLLNAAPFQGFDGLQPRGTQNPNMPREIDFTLARASARVIQFFEQAYDWENMMTAFYPYFWADRDDWYDLGIYAGSDPEFEEFMRAGSARVVLPVRKAFDLAVLHWLVYQEPFLGKPLPLPGDSMFMSVAEEIRLRTRAPSDGVAIDKAWDSRTPTTLVWLDDSPTLPRNSTSVLGAGAQTPEIPITLD